MPEQSLILDTLTPTVVTGCGHFGIENITKVAREVIGKDIECVMGGFHLLRSDEEKILQTIEALKNMGVQCAKPTHCTGDKAISLFEVTFK